MKKILNILPRFGEFPTYWISLPEAEARQFPGLPPLQLRSGHLRKWRGRGRDHRGPLSLQNPWLQDCLFQWEWWGRCPAAVTRTLTWGSQCLALTTVQVPDGTACKQCHYLAPAICPLFWPCMQGAVRTKGSTLLKHVLLEHILATIHPNSQRSFFSVLFKFPNCAITRDL